MKRRTLTAGLASGFALALSGCVSRLQTGDRKQTTKHRALRANDETRLHVRNENGSVDVRRYDGDDVDVTMKIRGSGNESPDATTLSNSRSGNELRLDVDPGSDDVSVALTVRYPNSVSVGQVRSENGSIDAELSTSGDSAVVRTENGSIDVKLLEVTGDTNVRTESGSIDATLDPDLDATVSARTKNGSVNASGLDFTSEGLSKNGFSGVLGDGSNDLSFETENGSISIAPVSK